VGAVLLYFNIIPAYLEGLRKTTKSLYVLTLLASEMLPRVDLPKFRWQVLLKCRYLHGVTSQKTSDITCAIALCLK